MQRLGKHAPLQRVHMVRVVSYIFFAISFTCQISFHSSPLPSFISLMLKNVSHPVFAFWLVGRSVGLYVRRGNRCWPSPAESFLVSGPSRLITKFLFIPRSLMCFEIGPLLEKGGVGLPVQATYLLHRTSASVYSQWHSVQVRGLAHYRQQTHFVTLP